MEFHLPELGEGIEAATVVSVLVQPGESVAAGQNVLAVETDKASMEVPLTEAGTVGEVRVKPGDKIAVGAVILTLTGASKNGAAKAPSNGSPPPAASPSPTPSPAPAAAATPAAPASSGPVEFRLPELGEGIEAATVVQVSVKAGDAVTAGQTLLSVETDKAALEVPSEVAGTVGELFVKPGDKVTVGQKLLVMTGTVQVMPSGSGIPVAAKPAPDKPLPTEPVKAPPTADGYTTASGPAGPAATVARMTHAAPSSNGGPKAVVAAGPATRRLARELGVSLGEVKPSGRSGRVTLDDIKGHVKAKITAAPSAPAGPATGRIVDVFAVPPLPDFAKYGEVERKPVSNIRKKIAENLTVAVRVIPSVTQNDIADITDLEAGRKRIVDGLPKGSPKVTWTVLAVKAVVAVLKEFPNFNSSFDMNAGELVVKKYYHIGIAVDTERGLVVPVIKNADAKSIRDIASEVASIAEKARTGKLTIDEMRGGTFTITNLGGIGGTSFTPIVNYPEVAILGLSRSTLQPVVKDGAIVPRLMMPMSLTYDHRVIDGADGARFTTRLAQLFSDPIRLLMES